MKSVYRTVLMALFITLGSLTLLGACGGSDSDSGGGVAGESGDGSGGDASGSGDDSGDGEGSDDEPELLDPVLVKDCTCNDTAPASVCAQAERRGLIDAGRDLECSDGGCTVNLSVLTGMSLEQLQSLGITQQFLVIQNACPIRDLEFLKVQD